MPKRIYVRVSDDVYEKVEVWAKKFGVTLSQLGGMALTAGIDQILRAVDPVASLSDDQLAKLLRAGQSAGIELDIEKALKRESQ